MTSKTLSWSYLPCKTLAKELGTDKGYFKQLSSTAELELIIVPLTAEFLFDLLWHSLPDYEGCGFS